MVTEIEEKIKSQDRERIVEEKFGLFTRFARSNKWLRIYQDPDSVVFLTGSGHLIGLECFKDDTLLIHHWGSAHFTSS